MMCRWLQNIIDLLLPPRCLLCGKVLSGENGLCADCFQKIRFISEPICRRCGTPLPSGRNGPSCAVCVSDKNNPFRMLRSQVYYDDNSRPLLLGLKFYDKTENAPFLARWLYAAGHDIWQQGVDMIVPVPLHPARLRHRRYNQAALLCAELAKLSGLPVDYTALQRHKNTRPQVEFNGRERTRNVKNAFSVSAPNVFKGKRVVVVDDVMTTGSTLRECALALLAAGAMSVDALTVARVVRG